MAVFIPNGQWNPASLQADDLYISILQPPGFVQGVPTDVFAAVGTASWGKVNTPVHMGSPFDALTGFGPVSSAALTDPYDLATDLAIAFGQAASQASIEAWGVRVTDGTDTAATASIAGAATSSAETATMTGTISDGDSATISFNTAYATAVFTESGSNNFSATDTLQIGNNTFTIVSSIGVAAGNVLKGATFADTAANLVAAIMGTSGEGTTYITPTNTPNVTAVAGTGVITFTSIAEGTSGNSLASVYTASATSAGAFGGSTFSGGALTAITVPIITADTLGSVATKFATAINASAALVAAGVYASVVGAVVSIYQPTALSPQITFTKTDGTHLTVTLASGAPSTTGLLLTAVCTGSLGDGIACTVQAGSAQNTYTVFLSLAALSMFEMYPNVKTAGGFWNNLASAINRGMSNVRGPSAICTASNANIAVGAPTLATVTASGGTDGRTGVTTATLIGDDSVQPKTGMYALRQLNPGVGVAWLCGCTDITAPATLLPFGLSEGIVMLHPFAAGTTTAAALSLVSSIGVHDPSFAYVKDWVYWFDVLNNQVRLVAPTAFIGGRIATLSPCVDPGNEPVNLVEGTERYNPFQSANQPYTVSEVGQLESAGVMFITNPIPAGAEWGIRHGQTTSLSPATGGVEWWRMNVFLARSFAKTMGQFVDQNQSQKPDDPLRRAVKNQLNTFLTFLVSPASGAGDGNGLIDDFDVICTFSSSPSAVAGNGVNTPASIAQHYLFVLVRVRFLSNVRFFILAIQGGTTVVTVGATQGQQLAA